MTLFAVVSAYIALRPPAETTETAKPAVAKTKSSIAPEARAARLKRDLANKAIRDKERELWAELSPHLSPYELREYKRKHSQTARELREESAWFEPSKAEFLALYTSGETP